MDHKTLTVVLSNKEAELDELRLQMLASKSELLDKDAQIEQMMATLTAKGEEAGILCEKLIDLKNHLLDQTVFEETWHVRLVKLAEHRISPMQSQGKQQTKELFVPREMTLNFVRDTSREGEFFLLIQAEGTRRLIPMLHIKCLDSKDSLTFIVCLLDELVEAGEDGYSYDESIGQKQP